MKITAINNTTPTFKATLQNEQLISCYFSKEDMEHIKEHVSKLGTKKDTVEFSKLRYLKDEKWAMLTVNMNAQNKESSFNSFISTDMHLFSRENKKRANNILREISAAFGVDYKIKADEDIINKKELTQPQITKNKNETNSSTLTKENNKNTTNLVNENKNNENSKELEKLIDKKIEEKFRALQNKEEKTLTKQDVENLVDKKLVENLKSDKNIQRIFKETIKNSEDEVAKALYNYTNTHKEDELHYALSRYLNIADPNYTAY